jgi:hypothetical protein
VAPQRAEVVVVDEPFAPPQAEAAETHLPGVVAEERTAVVVQAVLAAVHLETVQMVTGPAEGDLENIVKAGHGGVAADEQAPPDQRADSPQHDAQLVDGQGCTECCHAPSSPGPRPRTIDHCLR